LAGFRLKIIGFGFRLQVVS